MYNVVIYVITLVPLMSFFFIQTQINKIVIIFKHVIYGFNHLQRKLYVPRNQNKFLVLVYYTDTILFNENKRKFTSCFIAVLSQMRATIGIV